VGRFGALALLLLFAAGIAINLVHGRKPDCHCFGQLHSSPAGWSTLARNGVLAAVAAFLVWQGREGAGPSIVNWLGNLTAAQLLALVGGVIVLGLLATQWWLLLNLLRQNGRLLVRIDAVEERLAAAGLSPSQNGTQPAAGLPVGSSAPVFGLSGLYREKLTLDSLRAPGKPIVLIFTDPNCGPCTALLPEIGRWQREHSDEVTISLISRGTPEENRAKRAEHGVERVLLQQDWEVAGAYQVAGTPSAVLISPEGTVGSPLVSGSQAIAALVAQAVEGQAPCLDCGKGHAAAPTVPVGKRIGEPAPELVLPDLSGKSVDLADFRGEKTLVLFWNPAAASASRCFPTSRRGRQIGRRGLRSSWSSRRARRRRTRR
jgi:peroxiredoxin